MSHMDYLHMEPKQGKMQQQLTEERFDSGVDSLKEDECYNKIVEEMCSLDVSAPLDVSTYTHEAWKDEVTEDGDT